ncbi:hypothetical protein FACS189454_04060 [Planctomycetales bacterium]|nr:hypothetical protein FACS189454_04060 [Planctomycetales bacterium]
MSNLNVKYIVAALILVVVLVYYVTATIHRNKTMYNSDEEKTIKFGGRIEIPFKRFSGVETLRGEKSPKLVVEIAKVIEQKGLPNDIFPDNVSPNINIAVTLTTAFQEYDEKDSSEQLRKLWGASPLDVWDVDPKAIDSVKDILPNFEIRRTTVRRMVQQETTCFYCIFSQHPKTWSKTLSTDASRYIADYALLEEYHIAKALQKGDIGAAAEALAYIFRLCQLADTLPVVGVRSDAALTRLRAFEIMQRVVLDPKCGKAHLAFLRDMLTEQLDNWTPESDTWFGDRASGILLYHKVMMFSPEEALEPAEIEELKQRNVYRTFIKGFMKRHADDEAYYLQEMQRYLNICQEPFYKRIETVNLIHNATLKLTDTAAEPFVAAILLKDVDRIMRVFAIDISRIETATLALRLALGTKSPADFADPFTGEPYEVKRTDDGFIEVSAKNNRRPFKVPDLTKTNQPPLIQNK